MRRTNADVVNGGPSCKGFSLANKMTHDMSNPMNHLMLHYFEMVKRLKPAAFIMENVPGILAMENGNVVKSFVEEFRGIGYHNAEFWLLNAADYGVPQIRKRAFIVGSKSNIPIQPPIKTHGSEEETKNNPSLHPYVKLIDAIDDLPKIKEAKTTSYTDRYVAEPNDFQKIHKKPCPGGDKKCRI